MLSQSLVEPNNSISLWIFVPKFRWRPKIKVSAAFWFYLGPKFWISSCLVGITCQKPRGPDIFHPIQCQTWGGTSPALPKIDAYVSTYCRYFCYIRTKSSLKFNVFCPITQIYRSIFVSFVHCLFEIILNSDTFAMSNMSPGNSREYSGF